MHEEFMFMDWIVDSHVVPHFVSYGFLASIVVIIIALIVRGAMALVPRGTQNVVEVVAGAMLQLAEDSIGEHWGRPFFPLIATIFIYIMVCNFFGLIPGFVSPTANLNMTASMAVPVFLATHYYGFRVHKFSYMRHFFGPIQTLLALPLMLLMFVIEVISHLARPLTLSVRLFGNMTAKHQLLLVLAVLVPLFAPVPILVLGVLVSVVQAFVFALLTTLYLAGAVEEAH
ncbi:MAG: F0F1 ATP synthase subunit A [Nitrospirota bacterium]|jgi:F-type H+-transporting ATPase subunit a